MYQEYATYFTLWPSQSRLSALCHEQPYTNLSVMQDSTFQMLAKWKCWPSIIKEEWMNCPCYAQVHLQEVSRVGCSIVHSKMNPPVNSMVSGHPLGCEWSVCRVSLCVMIMSGFSPKTCWHTGFWDWSIISLAVYFYCHWAEWLSSADMQTHLSKQWCRLACTRPVGISY